METAPKPTGRSSYDPRRVRVGQPQPQSHPELFSVEDLKAEIKHLETLDRRLGRHPLRAAAKLQLLSAIAARREA